ncbi:hypothetical protein Ppb6_04074 [Photorhabdus australis subsp. thailandensis]|uniref:Nucleoside 2-deoxyribosyltransferase n=1 Tax=Photorhabdus australis subsp. thailandensis TaxID=2805096 RepID=A0A1C0TZF5_9GAMM|nr:MULTISPECIES: DUF4406 domain-containing protein [Photorhabdus]MBS9435541.1 DUF4406 domain-containing protein [Photorhabdus hainanensis]OCQ50976.1 hypothetical protein Ppb6_04074 [Photorhabdus australis subsp. thailandensis]
MTPVVFISGPMTGKPNFNRDAFNLVAKQLKSQGLIVLNPAVHPDGLTHEQYMRMSLVMLEQADAIYLLDGWENSTGAVMEFDRAKMHNLMFMYDSWDVFHAAAARNRKQRGKMNDE